MKYCVTIIKEKNYGLKQDKSSDIMLNKEIQSQGQSIVRLHKSSRT